MAFLHLQDTKLYYEVEGEGYPLIFVHGMGLSHVNWRAQVDFLTLHGYKTITFDIRGHGRSTETKEAYREYQTLAQMTLDLYHLLKKLDIEEGVFIAYSTGTVIAQQFALSYPEMVKGLLLTGAFPKISNLYLYGKFGLGLGLTYLNARKILEKSVAIANGKDKQQTLIFDNEAQKVKKREVIRILKASLKFDCRDQLKDITVPILVTYGGNEKHMMTYRKDYLTYAPTAEICLFPHVHHATLTKYTETYNEVFLDFITSLDVQGKSRYFFNPNNISPTPSPINNSLE